MWNKKKKDNKIIMLASSKLNGIENNISETMKLVMKILWQLLMKKTIVNLKKALGWWKVKEVILKKKITWLKKVNKEALIKLLNAMNLLITVESLKYKTMLFYCLKCKKMQKI